MRLTASNGAEAIHYWHVFMLTYTLFAVHFDSREYFVRIARGIVSGSRLCLRPGGATYLNV